METEPEDEIGLAHLARMWMDYCDEVHGRKVHVDVWGRGFLTFERRTRGMWITEIYVRPECRRGGCAREMLRAVEEHAQEEGLPFVYGTLDATSNTWRDSLAAQEACGFVLQAVEDGKAVLVKVVGPTDD